MALEFVALLFFWVWVASGVWFLRNTIIPKLPISSTPAAWNLPFESVSFQATDGMLLSGWVIPGDPQKAWIILCHGLGANRADLLEIAAWLVQAGYNAFLFDFRGHGESGGRSSSFGGLEQRDLEGALVYLGTRAGDRPYGIYGVSMGGAVALMVAARDERLGVVVTDSAYADLNDAVAHYVKVLYRLPRMPFVLFANTAYRLRFGAWMRQMSPARVIGDISPRPVMIVHGKDDPQVPVAHAQRLYKAARSPKELVLMDTEGHLQGPASDLTSYTQHLLEAFDHGLNSGQN